MTDSLSAIVGILLVAVVAGFALLPFLQPSTRAVPASLPESAEAERFRIYRQVLELEFDYQTGKLAPEDHAALTRELLAHAAQLLRAEVPLEQDVEAEVEREIAAARRTLASAREQREETVIPS